MDASNPITITEPSICVNGFTLGQTVRFNAAYLEHFHDASDRDRYRAKTCRFIVVGFRICSDRWSLEHGERPLVMVRIESANGQASYITNNDAADHFSESWLEPADDVAECLAEAC